MKALPPFVVARTSFALRTMSITFVLSRSTLWKSARMPSSIIWRLMLTMWPWRIFRRLTMSVSCMRERELVALHVHGEDADLALLHVGGDRRRQIDERPLGDVFEDERLVGRADLLDLVHEAGGDVFAIAIGNDRDALVRLHVEADANRVAGARGEFLVERGQSSLEILTLEHLELLEPVNRPAARAPPESPQPCIRRLS